MHLRSEPAPAQKENAFSPQRRPLRSSRAKPSLPPPPTPSCGRVSVWPTSLPSARRGPRRGASPPREGDVPGGDNATPPGGTYCCHPQTGTFFGQSGPLGYFSLGRLITSIFYCKTNMFSAGSSISGFFFEICFFCVPIPARRPNPGGKARLYLKNCACGPMDVDSYCKSNRDRDRNDQTSNSSKNFVLHLSDSASELGSPHMQIFLKSASEDRMRICIGFCNANSFTLSYFCFPAYFSPLRPRLANKSPLRRPKRLQEAP